jgi:hypothetical protein
VLACVYAPLGRILSDQDPTNHVYCEAGTLISCPEFPGSSPDNRTGAELTRHAVFAVLSLHHRHPTSLRNINNSPLCGGILGGTWFELVKSTYLPKRVLRLFGFTTLLLVMSCEVNVWWRRSYALHPQRRSSHVLSPRMLILESSKMVYTKSLKQVICLSMHGSLWQGGGIVRCSGPQPDLSNTQECPLQVHTS